MRLELEKETEEAPEHVSPAVCVCGGTGASLACASGACTGGCNTSK